MFRFPADPRKRQQWLEALNLAESDINDQSRVCSRHFLHGDSSNIPMLNLGSRFASPRKDSERSKRAQKRRRIMQSPTLVTNPEKRQATSRASSVSTHEEVLVTASYSDSSILSPEEANMVTSMPAALSDSSSFILSSEGPTTALAARVEMLEAETRALHAACNKFSPASPVYFRLEQISYSDRLIQFYTGFVSHRILTLIFLVLLCIA